MSIESQADLEGLTRAGRVVALAIAAMRRSVRPGMSTKELDDVGARVFREHGARSAPQLAYGFPGVNCISLNEEAVHGVPSRRRFIARGDLVKIDVTAELDGYVADAAVTVEAGSWTPERQRLLRTAASALGRGLKAARAGATTGSVGEAIGSAVALRGYRVIPELGGHGIGRAIHEAPSIPNHRDAKATTALTEGLVVTVEPIITAGVGRVRRAPDGWTLPTADGRLSAHVEHTIVVTRDRPLILTRLGADASHRLESALS
jgi:methionyl aminopeptidase